MNWETYKQFYNLSFATEDAEIEAIIVYDRYLAWKKDDAGAWADYDLIRAIRKLAN